MASFDVLQQRLLIVSFLVEIPQNRKVHFMKKALIGVLAGAAALGSSIVPASAGFGEYLEGSAWDAIRTGYACEEDGATMEQLVLIADYANVLNSGGNSKPYYTVFQPLDEVLVAVIDALDTSMAKLASAPSVVRGILDDHIANGSFAPEELARTTLTRITMRSGFVMTVSGAGDQIYPDVARSTIILNGVVTVLYGTQVKNGWVYCIGGFIDSTGQVPTEGLNALDSPKDGTPGGSNSLPDTL